MLRHLKTIFVRTQETWISICIAAAFTSSIVPSEKRFQGRRCLIELTSTNNGTPIMGIVWETYHKGVPLFGGPWNLEFDGIC